MTKGLNVGCKITSVDERSQSFFCDFLFVRSRRVCRVFLFKVVFDDELGDL